jgi:hypothetical protein
MAAMALLDSPKLTLGQQECVTRSAGSLSIFSSPVTLRLPRTSSGLRGAARVSCYPPQELRTDLSASLTHASSIASKDPRIAGKKELTLWQNRACQSAELNWRYALRVPLTVSSS